MILVHRDLEDLILISIIIFLNFFKDLETIEISLFQKKKIKRPLNFSQCQFKILKI